MLSQFSNYRWSIYLLGGHYFLYWDGLCVVPEADTFRALKVSPLWLIILAIGYFFTKSKKS